MVMMEMMTTKTMMTMTMEMMTWSNLVKHQWVERSGTSLHHDTSLLREPWLCFVTMYL